MNKLPDEEREVAFYESVKLSLTKNIRVEFPFTLRSFTSDLVKSTHWIMYQNESGIEVEAASVLIDNKNVIITVFGSRIIGYSSVHKFKHWNWEDLPDVKIIRRWLIRQMKNRGYIGKKKTTS